MQQRCCLPATLQESSRTCCSSCSSSVWFPPETRLSRRTGNSATCTPISALLWTSGQSKNYFQHGIFRRRLGPLKETDGGDTQIHTNAPHHRTTKWQVVLEVLVQSADGCEGFFCSFFLLFFILEKQVEVHQWCRALCFPAIRPVQLSFHTGSKFPWSEKVAVIFFTLELKFASQKG